LNLFDDCLQYRVELKWDGKTGGTVECQNCGDLKIDMPQDFAGFGRSPCPDQLFLASIGGCLLTTFLHFARRLHLDVRDIRIPVREQISLRKSEGYRITAVEAEIQVDTDGEYVELAGRCAELARDYCHITRSMEASIPVNVSIKVHSARMAL
jgi:organic hydroperoxide reductase OsmC/OhrA